MEYEILHIKDEERNIYGSLNEGALIYINSRSKVFHNKLGLAYGQQGQHLSARWSQDFYIYRNGYFYEQVPDKTTRNYWKLPEPAGGGLTFRGVAHWKNEETEIMKNLNYFIENYEVIRYFDDEVRSLRLLKKLLMILKDSKNPAYMKPIVFHFLGSGRESPDFYSGGSWNDDGINESEARDIEDWCESMSYQGFNIQVIYHYMKSPDSMWRKQFYVFRDGSGPYRKDHSPNY